MDDFLFTTLSQVNEKEFTLNLGLALLMCWYEPRLEFLHNNNTPEFVMDPTLQDRIWVPDAEIGPLKSLTRIESLHKGRLTGTYCIL